MNKKQSLIALATIGTLFSGYLTSRWFAGICTGGCSLLGSYPTCLYGLVMYLVILAASIRALKKECAIKATRVVFWTAIAGMLFSLYYSVLELIPCQFCYWLGLPNCVYGFVMYGAVAWLAHTSLRTEKPLAKGRKRSKKKR